jgi:DNA-directed RNA polymerase specialized sigma subunit
MARTAAKFTLNDTQRKLVEDNLNLARREAWRYHRKTDIDYKTLESVAFEGLCQAAWRYDPCMVNDRTDQPMKFSSIAVPYTRGAILHYVRDRTYLLKLSHKMRESWLKGRRLLYKGVADQEIADTLGLELIEWLETRVTCSGPPLELKEQGSPTIDAEITEADSRPHYLNIASEALSKCPEKDRQKLEGFFKGTVNQKACQEALKSVLNDLVAVDCPEVSLLDETPAVN